MKAKMYICNMVCCIMALISAFCFIEAIWVIDILPNLYLGTLCFIAATAYHWIGKTASHG